MSAVRDRDTKPEIQLRKALWHRGLRYRLRYKIPGKPDLAFPGPKVAVFVDGCFWHGCPMHGQTPKTNRGFWTTKLRENTERDMRINYRLRGLGWNVIRVWEHELKDGLDDVADRIETAVRGKAMR